MKDTQKKKMARNYHLLRRAKAWKCCRVTAIISGSFVQTAAESKQIREI